MDSQLTWPSDPAPPDRKGCLFKEIPCRRDLVEPEAIVVCDDFLEIGDHGNSFLKLDEFKNQTPKRHAYQEE
jgi:hypothetical protein